MRALIATKAHAPGLNGDARANSSLPVPDSPKSNALSGPVYLLVSRPHFLLASIAPSSRKPYVALLVSKQNVLGGGAKLERALDERNIWRLSPALQKL